MKHFVLSTEVPNVTIMVTEDETKHDSVTTILPVKEACQYPVFD